MRFDLDQAVAVLERTPSVLCTLLADLPRGWTRTNEGGESWSAYDVLGHLIHGERTDWVPRARIILDEGEGRTFEPFDRFAQERESHGQSLGDLLTEFARLREENLETLKDLGLSPGDLERRGRHPELGSVTLEELLATWVVHDLGHLAQIGRAMAAHYAEDVGPWADYLPVLDRVRS